MCGIAGVVGKPGQDYSSAVERMTRALQHRGPDAEGFHVDLERGIALGHRRLSIIDLSERANQPMGSEDGRFMAVYNGEVYNFVELRQELERAGCCFRTTSDTEVVLQAFATWGSGCFSRFRGMFSVGIVDTTTATVTLARDPLGIKPLYTLARDGVVSFASEARVLWRHAPGGDRCVLDEAMQQQVVIHGYLPDREATLVRGIQKVPPGSVMTICRGETATAPYWALGRDASWEGLSFDEGAERFEALFRDTMRIMLRSDVPLGFLLSGGLDSSFVTAMARAEGASDLRTFTATFGHPLDEGEPASRAAQHLGASHEEFRVDVGDITGALGDAMETYDEMSTTDPGLFTVSLVARAIAKQGVKVAFVGEGADEILGGYSWFGLSQLPFRLLPTSLRALGYFYATRRLASPRYWRHAACVADAFRASGERDILRQVSSCEVNLQLPNHLLQKVDRGTMASSIEARVPYMDHEIVTAAYSMPASWKRSGAWFRFRSVQEKRILRHLAAKVLPGDIADRKKRGFMLPVADLILENRDFVRDVLLAQDSLARGLMPANRLERLTHFKRTMYCPVEKEKEVLTWRLLLLSLWHRRVFKGSGA